MVNTNNTKTAEPHVWPWSRAEYAALAWGAAAKQRWIDLALDITLSMPRLSGENREFAAQERQYALDRVAFFVAHERAERKIEALSTILERKAGV